MESFIHMTTVDIMIDYVVIDHNIAQTSGHHSYLMYMNSSFLTV